LVDDPALCRLLDKGIINAALLLEMKME
jgi:hypothetical protein